MAKKSSPQDKLINLQAQQLAALVYGVSHASEASGLYGLRRFDFSVEVPQVNESTGNSQPRQPTISNRSISRAGFFQAYPTMLRGSRSFLRAILVVLSGGDQTKITPPIIKMLSVSVVYDDRITVANPHDFPMQVQRFTRNDTTGSIIGSQVPSVTQRPNSIGAVYQAVRANRIIASVQGHEGDILMAHQGSLLVSCLRAASTVAEAFCVCSIAGRD